MKLKVHIVEDTEAFLFQAERALRASIGLKLDKNAFESVAFDVLPFDSPDDWEARHRAGQGEDAPDICLLDIEMNGDPDAGLTLAKRIRSVFPQSIVVMYSQWDDADTIVRLMAAGADSFISKKSTFDELAPELLHAYRVSLRKRPIVPFAASQGSLVCAGRTLEEVEARVPQIINSAVRAVAIEGETGTGKEVVADLFEAALKRSQGPVKFIRVNCGAIPAGLIESELLGHRKGAFTGADSERIGLLESANGGWIFLDEVATLSTQAQITLLRVIENQSLTRVGESRERRISVRFLSACNEPLEAQVNAGRFRRDLWQRLTETRLTLPPLRERKDEIAALVRHFCNRFDGGPFEVTQPALELLQRCDWNAGNVRELRNCLRAMTEYADSTMLGPNTIPAHVFTSIAAMVPSPEVPLLISFALTEKSCHLAPLERRLFAEAIRFLMKQPGNRTLRTLERDTGLARSTLTSRLREAVKQGDLAQSDFDNDFWKRNLGGTLSKGISLASALKVKKNDIGSTELSN